jgi:hypothetical protein
MKQDKPNQARLSSGKKTTLPQAANRHSASAKLRSEQTDSRVVWPKNGSGVQTAILAVLMANETRFGLSEEIIARLLPAHSCWERGVTPNRIHRELRRLAATRVPAVEMVATATAWRVTEACRYEWFYRHSVRKLIIENPDGKLFAELPLTEPEFAAIKRGARKKLMSVPEFVRSAVVAMLAKVESQLEGGIR